MKMTLRWFGKDFDSVTLQQIRQIPGVTGVITTLYDIPAGDVWPIERIKAMQAEVEAEGLKVDGMKWMWLTGRNTGGQKRPDPGGKTVIFAGL